MPLKETIRGFQGIPKGEYDDLPEQAFYMVGGIEEVVRSQKLCLASMGGPMAEMISLSPGWMVSAEASNFSGRCNPPVSGSEGELGLRHGHAPLLTAIKPGLVRLIKSKWGRRRVLYVSAACWIQPKP